MKATHERRPSTATLSDRSIDDLLDEKSILEEERSAVPYRRGPVVFFACCVASLSCALLALDSAPPPQDDGVVVREEAPSRRSANVSFATSVTETWNASTADGVSGVGVGATNLFEGEQETDPSSPAPTLVVRSQFATEQIASYKRNQSIIVNVHITHHAGTSLCAYMQQIGPTPSFACMGERNKSVGELNVMRPWSHNETGETARRLREHFHMVSWEFGKVPRRPLSGVNWEDPRVVSMIVMRNPIDRSLSGDGKVNGKYGAERVRSHENWWAYAQSAFTNNFALNRLTTPSSNLNCALGENTTEACVQEAKELLKRFTFVLDQACLAEGLAALAKELDIAPPKLKPEHHHESAKDRINDTELFDYMSRRMRRDTELYQWSKDISLVKCKT